MTSSLAALFAARLAESEVTPHDAKHAGLTLLTPDAVAELYPGAPRQGAVRIVYHTPGGKATPFYRLRLLGTATGLNGQLAKPKRYLQPPDTGVRAYLPRTRNVNWLEVMNDPEVALIITEGEFKALSACLHGYPTIGLGGVENWRSAKARKPLIDDLSAVNWKGRNLYICYDSDVATKPQVAEASRRLAEELGARGARVFDAGLPASPDKVGLDDFLRDRGTKALEKHLAEALEFASLAVLHEFNERFLFIRTSGRVYEPRVHDFYDASKFINAVEANAVYQAPKLAGTRVAMERRYAARDWLEWPQRRTVQRLTYRPGDDRLIVDSDVGAELNLWTGWGCAPAKGDLRPWVKLFDHLTSGESETVRVYLEQWLAYPLQHPGVKLYTAVAMWGAQTGTGKTLLGETMLAIYGNNGQSIGARQLGGAYNGWLERKQFVLGDEITGTDSRQHADELKGLLTSDRVRVNEKYEREYDLPNCVNFYFTSNHPDAFFLDDADRRFLVLEAPYALLPQEFYEEYRVWLKSTGPAALFHYLLRVDTRDFAPRARALPTHAKEMMVETGKSEVGRFVAMVRHDSERAQALYGVPADVELFTTSELRSFYDPRGEKRATEKAISLELQKQGAAKVLKGAQLKIEGLGRVRLYAVRETDQWHAATAADVLRYMARRALPTAKF